MTDLEDAVRDAAKGASWWSRGGWAVVAFVVIMSIVGLVIWRLP